MSSDFTQAIKAREDDQLAWEGWFNHVYSKVYYIVYRQSGGDEATSQECAQAAIERFIRYRGLDKVSDDRTAVAYIARAALRWLSDEGAHQSRFTTLPEAVIDDDAPGAGLDSQLDLDRLASALSHANQYLLALIRAGHTVDEIAKNLDISYSAAGVRIHRLKTALTKLVDRV